jgi:hypothetical protein
MAYTDLDQPDLTALATTLQGLSPGVGTGYRGAHPMGHGVRPEPTRSTDPNNPTCFVLFGIRPNPVTGTLEDDPDPARESTVQIAAVAQAGTAIAVYQKIGAAALEALRNTAETGYLYNTGIMRLANSAPTASRPQPGFLELIWSVPAWGGVS